MSKKKNDSSANEVFLFAGKCNKCAENFEASSKSDDLHGIVFKCKKLLCDGRVTLAAVSSPLPGNPESHSKKSSSPRRYC